MAEGPTRCVERGGVLEPALQIRIGAPSVERIEEVEVRYAHARPPLLGVERVAGEQPHTTPGVVEPVVRILARLEDDPEADRPHDGEGLQISGLEVTLPPT